MQVKASVPGKIILSGEHAVVYGKPAIAAAVDKRLTVTLQSRNDGKKIIQTDADDTKLIDAAIKVVKNGLEMQKKGFDLNVKSEIPIGAGMGSSAAVAVAVAATLVVASTGQSKLDLEKINKLAYEVERIQHGTPSGIDNFTVTFGGFLWYRKELEFLKTFWKLQFKVTKDMQHFYLINTGKPVETTGEMVKMVKQKLETADLTLEVLHDIEGVTKKVLLGIRGEDEKLLLSSMSENERLLEKLGVVGEFAKNIVQEIEQSGGVAKISGAGGVKDRSGILLVYHKDKNTVAKIAKKHNLDWFPAKLGAEGVRIESIEA